MNFSLRGFAEAFGFALAALLLYLWSLPDAFYKVDGIDIVRLYHEGSQHPWHPGYLPALRGFHWLVETLGFELDLLTLGSVFSAVGAAIGVGFARAGMGRLGMAPAIARLATAVFMTCPIVVTFAVVVEFHGPLLLPYGLCFWWLAEQVRRPTVWGMVVLGGLSHLPFLIHGQQLLLPCWMLAFFVAKRGISRQSIVLVVIAGSTHSLLFVLMPQLFPGFYGFWSELAAGAEAEGSIGRPQSLDYTPRILWQEWVSAWAPLSLLVFLAALRRVQRPEFFAFLIGFLPYLFVSVRQLVFEPEYGAYLLPMVLPAAMIVARRLGGHRALWLVLAFHLPGSHYGQWQHLEEQRNRHDGFRAMVERAAPSKPPFVLVGSHAELGHAFARLSPDEFLWVRQNAVLPRANLGPQQLAGVEFYLKQLHQQGRVVLLTDSALSSLEDPRGAMLAEKSTLKVDSNDQLSGPLFLAHLRKKFEFEPAVPGVRRLVPK